MSGCSSGSLGSAVGSCDGRCGGEEGRAAKFEDFADDCPVDGQLASVVGYRSLTGPGEDRPTADGDEQAVGRSRDPGEAASTDYDTSLRALRTIGGLAGGDTAVDGLSARGAGRVHDRRTGSSDRFEATRQSAGL